MNATRNFNRFVRSKIRASRTAMRIPADAANAFLEKRAAQYIQGFSAQKSLWRLFNDRCLIYSCFLSFRQNFNQEE